MGGFCSCFGGSTENEAIIQQPSVDERRRQMEEAAERRRMENENRGIKDPEKVRRMQQRQEEMAKREEELAKSGSGNPSLRWQTG